jgi:formate/nitrite transporter
LPGGTVAPLSRVPIETAPPTPATDPALRFDALLPREMAARAEAAGVSKTTLDAPSTLVLAVMAGAFIALGAVFSTVAVAGAGPAPWGLVRVVAGLVFSLGLILVVVGGAELFTGNTLIVMAWAGGRVTTRAVLRHWALVYAGNAAGALSVALTVAVAGTHHGGGGAVGAAALELAAAKLSLGPVQALALGVLCNALVCLAVWLALSARSTTDRILAVVPPISAFVAAGFEHSIANMYVVPYALLVAALDPGFVQAAGLAGPAAALGWGRFVLGNLLPVTVGNVIGGTLLVGGVYWFVYLRPRG